MVNAEAPETPDKSEPEKKSGLILFLDKTGVIVLLSIGFIAARIIIFSHGRTDVILLLLRNLDPPSIFLSAIIPNLGLFLLVVGGVILVAGFKTDSHPTSYAIGNALPYVGTVMLIASIYVTSFSDFKYLGSIIAVILVLLLLGKIPIKHRFYKRFAEIPNSFVMNWKEDKVSSIGIGLVGFLLLPNLFWLPAENITIEGPSKVSAYVLSTDSQFTSMISVDTLNPIIMRNDQIISREVCSLDGGDLRPWISKNIKNAKEIICWTKSPDRY